MPAMRVSVIGSGTATDRERDLAAAVGTEIVERGYELVCGGREGVMRAAAKAVADGGGHPIGILPGVDVAEANPHIAVPIVTGLGHMRNSLVVRNGDGVVAIGGHYGTLSEIALALDIGRPVVGLESHSVDGLTPVDSASEAIDVLETRIRGR